MKYFKNFCKIKWVKKMNIDYILNIMMEKLDWARLDTVFILNEEIGISHDIDES